MQTPFPAYTGSEPYVFVCYSHDDAAAVYPEITRLKDAGFHIWYDEGVAPGSEWSEILAERIKACSVFLYLVTPRSVLTEHCRREVSFALDQACVMVAVHLEPTDLPDGLKLTLSNRQAILKHEHPKADYEAKVAQALEDTRHDELSGSQAARVAPRSDTRLPDRIPSSRVAAKIGGLIALLVAGSAYFWLSGNDLAPAQPEDDRIRFDAIAVLPFIDSSVGQDLGVLADTVTRQLISRLDELPTLKVASLSAVAPLIGRNLPLADIGTILETPVALSGYVQRERDRVEFAVEIVRASDGRVLWSGSLSRDDDVRSRAVRFIAGELARFIGRISTVSERGPRSSDAYRAWLNWHFHRANFRNFDEVKWIEQVIQLEPTYSRARLDAFDSYYTVAMDGHDDRWVELAGGALAAAEKLGLAEDERYRSSLGRHLAYLMGDLNRGEVLMREADSPLYAALLMDSGLPEPAVEWFEFATSQQPMTGPWLGLGFARGMNGDLGGAVKAYEAGLRRVPDDPYLLFQHAKALAGLGRFVEAERSMSRLESLGPLPAGGDLARRVARYWFEGFTGNADAALAGAAALADEGRHTTAGLLLLEFGDPDAAAQQFELAAANLIPRDRMVSSWLHAKPEWANHPVVRPYLESLGYTPAWRREICMRAVEYASDLGVDLSCEAY